MPYLGHLIGSDHGLFIRARQMDKLRRDLVRRHEVERLVLKSIISSPYLPQEVRAAAVRRLADQPSNYSPGRLGWHCIYTRRAMGHVKEFKMSRITFRRLARHSLLPGLWPEIRGKRPTP
uniref:Ribosomal protein S14 n=2 Tax=Rhodosorus marinus TaxID=101924 RepID=A0A7S2ZS64_9RHOD|mmetsp:Transcript_30719/g.117523  ORF Transcript_30719/g.117523 Transcript_30719/m.117523 type:complete len:120 (+) Transcript_30719:160-519(+)